VPRDEPDGLGNVLFGRVGRGSVSERTRQVCRPPEDQGHWYATPNSRTRPPRSSRNRPQKRHRSCPATARHHWARCAQAQHAVRPKPRKILRPGVSGGIGDAKYGHPFPSTGPPCPAHERACSRESQRTLRAASREIGRKDQSYVPGSRHRASWGRAANDRHQTRRAKTKQSSPARAIYGMPILGGGCCRAATSRSSVLHAQGHGVPGLRRRRQTTSITTRKTA